MQTLNAGPGRDGLPLSARRAAPPPAPLDRPRGRPQALPA
ncbi:MAG: hypothetical protein JWM27_4069, partial [Gemmatimonadetes bacterium]|nr:hypothetical protein [Gemmatimonadota bacterium]